MQSSFTHSFSNIMDANVVKPKGRGVLARVPPSPCVLNTSVSIFCESIAFFVVKACERALPKASCLFFCCGCYCRLGSSEFPRVPHHELEVVVAVDRAAHPLVVFVELVQGDDAVGLLGIPLGHELLEDLIRCLLALFDLGVLTCVVDRSDVRQGHLPILVDIELGVGSTDPNLASLAKLTLYIYSKTLDIIVDN